MVKYMLKSSLLGILLLLSGCGDTEGESALQTQLLLDKGNYDAVIAKVELNASTPSDYLTLASAYMGKAGFSLTKIAEIVSSSATNNNGGEFASLVQSVQTKSNNDSLADINKAVIYYKKVIGNKCDKTLLPITLSAVDADICLYIGFANISQSAVAVNYITDDVAALSESGKVDDKLTASACAMQYAFNGTTSGQCTSIPKQDVTFTQSQKTYKSVGVIVNGKEFEYLLTAVPNGSSIITQGFCTVSDFTTRVNKNPLNSAYHACPLSQTNTAIELTTQSVLINALNGAIDSLKSAVSQDIQKDIDTFKADVLQSSGGNVDANREITTQDIINYFNLNNK